MLCSDECSGYKQPPSPHPLPSTFLEQIDTSNDILSFHLGIL